MIQTTAPGKHLGVLALLVVTAVAAVAILLAPRPPAPAAKVEEPALPPRLAITGDATNGVVVANGLRDPLLVDVTTVRRSGDSAHPSFVACVWRESPFPVRAGQQATLPPGKCVPAAGDQVEAVEVRAVNAVTGHDVDMVRIAKAGP